MARFPVLLSLALAGLAAPAAADELIRQANDQQALVLGVSRLASDLEATGKAGAPVSSRFAGREIELGYANTRMRNAFGLPGFYTRVEASLAFGGQDYDRNPVDPSSGAPGTTTGPTDVETESLRMRLGYTREFGPGRRLALTPFLGFWQQASHRGPATYSGSTVYYHQSAEFGLLGQATLTRKVVLGAEAARGRTLGAWQLGQHELAAPPDGTTTSLAVFLDNRTFADWHQRVVLRRNFVAFGAPEQSNGVYEPRRNSSFSIQLEFGTELDLF